MAEARGLNLRASVPRSFGGTSLHDAAELEDRENDAHGDKADHATHEDDHDGFDHGGYAFDDGFEFLGVKLADFVEHLAELTGFFTGADHLHDRAGEQG